MQKKTLSYCGNLVQTHDRDKFLISLFAPAHSREDIWALFAFNHEIAKTREIVSETTLGLIRLQWWRDAISNIYNEEIPPQHEILKPLALTIKRHNLPREHFDALIYAREFDLEDVRPGNLEGLMNYADFTTTPLLKLAVIICADNLDLEVIQPIAINFSLAGILRATPHLMRQNRYLLPGDLIKKYNITNKNIITEEGQKLLRPLIEEIISNKPPKSKPGNPLLKACEVLGDIYFKQIKSLNHNIMSPKLQHDPPFKALKLFWKTKIL